MSLKAAYSFVTRNREADELDPTRKNLDID